MLGEHFVWLTLQTSLYDVLSHNDWLFVENKNKAGCSTCLFFCTVGRKCWMPAPPRTKLSHLGLCQCCPQSAWLKPNALYWSLGRASRVLSRCLIFTHTSGWPTCNYLTCYFSMSTIYACVYVCAHVVLDVQKQNKTYACPHSCDQYYTDMREETMHLVSESHKLNYSSVSESSEQMAKNTSWRPKTVTSLSTSSHNLDQSLSISGSVYCISWVSPGRSHPYSRIQQAYTLVGLPVHQTDNRQPWLPQVGSHTHVSRECLGTDISDVWEVTVTTETLCFLLSPLLFRYLLHLFHNCSNFPSLNIR